MNLALSLTVGASLEAGAGASVFWVRASRSATAFVSSRDLVATLELDSLRAACRLFISRDASWCNTWRAARLVLHDPSNSSTLARRSAS